MQVKKSEIIEDSIQLFTEQGYHATSIQDILNRSGISKGTFYKHFQSKGELLQASLLHVEDKMNIERDRILIGQDESDKGVFIYQLEVMMESRIKHNFNALIEDALVSNDIDLLSFIKQMRMRLTSWIYFRFKQILPKKYEEYLIDASVLFTGMLQSIIYINSLLANKLSINSVCLYCVNRTEEFLDSVEGKKIKLFDTNEIEQSLYQLGQADFSYNELALSTGSMRKLIEKQITEDSNHQKIAIDLIMFIQAEVVTDNPKTALIMSSLTTLKSMKEIQDTQELGTYLETLSRLGYYPV